MAIAAGFFVIVPFMPSETFLLSIAGLALTLAGFTGAIEALRHARTTWKRNEEVGMRLIFESSFAAAFFALTPVPLWHTFESEPIIWRVCGFALAMSLIAGVWRYIRFANTLRLQNVPARVEWGLYWFIFPMTVVFVILLLGGSVLYARDWAYAWGLFWLIIVAGVQFFVFLRYFGNQQS